MVPVRGIEGAKATWSSCRHDHGHIGRDMLEGLAVLFMLPCGDVRMTTDYGRRSGRRRKLLTEHILRWIVSLKILVHSHALLDARVLEVVIEGHKAFVSIFLVIDSSIERGHQGLVGLLISTLQMNSLL